MGKAKWVHCKKCGGLRNHIPAQLSDSPTNEKPSLRCSLCGTKNNATKQDKKIPFKKEFNLQILIQMEFQFTD